MLGVSMPKSSALEFAATREGAAFFRAYDTVLGKWPVEVTAEQVESVFGMTWVNMCGPVDGPPVILVPGQRATSTVWFNNVGELSRQHRVFAIDIIGDAGRSMAAADTPIRSRADLIAWFGGIIDHFKLDAPDVVAHSYGAMIALAYALVHPKRVSKLVLLDPNSVFTGMRTPYLLRAVPLLTRPTGKRERDFITWETAGQPLDADWLDLITRGVADFPRGKTVVPKRPKATALAALTAQTTVILAEHSKVHDSNGTADKTHAALPAATTIILPGATHHTLPMSPAPALNSILKTALD